MSRYSQHPIEAKFQEWNQEHLKRRNDYWNALHRMRNDYLEENKGYYDMTSRPTIHYWAELKYGFKMGLDGQGNYTKDYTVVDPKKFMLFQLKYWK